MNEFIFNLFFTFISLMKAKKAKSKEPMEVTGVRRSPTEVTAESNTVRGFAESSMTTQYSKMEKQIAKLTKSIDEHPAELEKKKAKLDQLKLDLDQLKFIRDFIPAIRI
jgi:peroxiredoxin family protein